MDLLRFFEDIELLCDDVEMDQDTDHIKWAVRYANHTEAELWAVMPTCTGTDWDAFKVEVLTFYPGAQDDNRKYSHADLDRITAAQSKIPMTSHGILGEYVRKFTVVATFLDKRRRISKGECEVKFLEGFHPTFKAQLLNRLTLVYLDHFPDDPWPTDKVVYHASFLLAGTPTAAPSRVTASPELRSTSVPAPTVIKKEYYSTGSTFASEQVPAGSVQAPYVQAVRGPA